MTVTRSQIAMAPRRFPGKLASSDLIACILGTPDAPASPSSAFEETPRGVRLRFDVSKRTALLDREGRPIELTFPNDEKVKLQPGEGVPRRIEANGPEGRAVLTLESLFVLARGRAGPPGMTETGRALTVEAFAKVNRALRVLGKRPDGFHEIDTIFQTVDLTDTLFFLEGEEGDGSRLAHDRRGGASRRRKQPDPPSRPARFASGSRCAAAPVFTFPRESPSAVGWAEAVRTRLRPFAGLSALWQLPATDADLHALAVSLGSDVPFFLLGGRARGTGRGEILEPLPDGPEEWLVLAFPPFSLSTAAVYGAFSAPALTDSAAQTNLRGSEIRWRAGSE